MATVEQAQAPLWQDRIVKDPQILGDKPTVQGTWPTPQWAADTR